MKTKLFYLSLISLQIIFVIQACNTKRINQQSNIFSDKVKIIDMPEKYIFESNLDSVFKKVEFIPLENSKDCYLVNPSKVVYRHQHYYILDFRKGLYVFDRKGEFLHQIGKLGRGPGELLEINDFDFDDKGNILILDYKRVLRFNIDGNYLDTYLKFDFMKDGFYSNPYQFSFINPSCIYMWGGSLGIEESNVNNFAMYMVNGNKIVNCYFPLKYKLSDLQHRFLRCGSEYLINPILGNDTIYSIYGNKVSAKYFVKFKFAIDSKNIPNSLNSLSEFGYELLNNDRISYDVFNPLETQKWLSFTFTHKKQRIIALLDKNNNVLHTLNGFMPVDGKAGILMPYFFHFISDSSFGSIVSAREFLTIKNGIEKSNCSIKCMNITGYLVKKDDNHVILKYQPI